MADQQPERATSAPEQISILLAEDNPFNQKVATRMLQKIGYEADIVVNGKEALESLSQKRYHVILMDIQMPEMDGLEATRQIRKTYSVEQQPYIIAMTGHTSNEDRQQCLQNGMDDYISKPLKVDVLKQALQNVKK